MDELFALAFASTCVDETNFWGRSRKVGVEEPGELCPGNDVAELVPDQDCVSLRGALLKSHPSGRDWWQQRLVLSIRPCLQMRESLFAAVNLVTQARNLPF